MKDSLDRGGFAEVHVRRAALMVLLLLPAAGLAEGRFAINELKLKGEVANVIVQDLDGDGLKDLVVFHTDTSAKAPQRWVSVLWQDQAGFDSKRVFGLQAGPEIAAIDVGQVDGKEGLDLVGMGPGGVVYYPNQGRSFGPQTGLIQKDTALVMASFRTLPYVDFVADWNGDGMDDLLLFQFNQALLYPGGKTGIEVSKPQTLAIKPWADLTAQGGIKGDAAGQQDLVAINAHLPRMYARDWDGDGRLDLIATGRKDIRVFLQAEGGTYPAAAVKNFEVELFSPAEEHLSAQPYAPYNPPGLSFADLDHDGKTDVVASQVIGMLGKMKSKVALYWGRTGSLAAGKPDVVFTPKDLAIAGQVADVNHDGLLDLVVPTLGLNLFNVGRIFVSGTLPVQIEYYLQAKDHTFKNFPDYTHPIDLLFDLDKFRLAGGIPGVFGDFNGDGIPDEAAGKSKTQLEVTINDPAGKHTAVKETLTIPVSAIILTEDLNGDHKSDLILNYADDPDHQGELRVLMNRGNW